ncbi:MAG TPA: (Fe-S)-binding protein [Candidatus Binatia bacterium]|jgi:Fe-S oxidoreductase
MLTTLEKILFIALTLGAFYFAGTGFLQVFKTIRRGKPEDRFDRLPERVLQALWVVLTQQSVFKKRPLISFFHALVFYGFVYYFLVNVVDGVEGFFPFRARDAVWNPFNLIADLLTAGVLIGIVALALRRFVVRPRDFSFAPNVPLHEDVQGGIRRDSTIVSGFIFIHVGSRLLSKSAQLSLEGADPYQPAGSAFAVLFAGANPSAVTVFEHIFWWGALGSIMVFLPYFPRSKHIHILLAPINLALKKKNPGALAPMDFEKEESFGAAKLEEFPWPRLLDAYSCIMCNRCQDVCPAYATGKALSPAAILINERFELNRIRPEFSSGKESPRPLLDFALNEEATWACTTCNACIEVCPVGNEQMLHIIDVRRERVLSAAEFPKNLQKAFNGMEQVGNPWAMAPESRLDWAKGLSFPVPTVKQNPQPKVLYWVGCAAAFDPRAQKIARSMAEILNAAGVNWAVLGLEEKCTGDAARRAGNEYLFSQLATENAETLNGLKPELIITTCPHCLHTLKNEYPQFGGNYAVKHHSEFIDELVKDGKLKLRPEADGAATYHDPCYLGRHNGVFDAPRAVIESAGVRLAEPERKRRNSFCCGAGGAQFWKGEEPGRERVTANRYRELKATGAKTVATGCPFCMRMFTEEAGQEESGAPAILDVAEIVANNLRR